MTAFGPAADNSRAMSSSRKAWGLSGLACRPGTLVSVIGCYASAEKYSANSIRCGGKPA
ncbi:hypothetical protein JCM17478_11900 [Thermopirellula anaerolimosa]